LAISILERLNDFPGLTFKALPILLATGCSISFLALIAGKDLLLIASNSIRVRDFEEPALYRKVRELCAKSQLKQPEVFLLPELAINSCSGESLFGKAFIAISKGAIYKLSPEELEAITAHEIAHLKNGDSLIYTYSSVLLGAFSIISDWAYRNAYLILKSGLGNSFLIFSLSLLKLIFSGAIILAFMWTSPICRALLQLFISKKRDLNADSLAARYLCNPLALQSALSKANEDREPFVYLNSATEHCFFVNPNISRREKINQGDSIFFAHASAKSRSQIR
jgi:heat shock protein HtpX